MNFSLVERYRSLLNVIFVARMLKILIIYLENALLFREFGIVLNIIVLLHSFMKESSYLGKK